MHDIVRSWHEAGQFTTVKGHQIFFYRQGDSSKPVLFFIHGFPTSSWDWLPLWQGLIGEYQLLAADMLGFGFSDKPKHHGYSIHEQADILEAFLDDQGIEHYHVIAHDYGDTVAQEMLARENARAIHERRFLSLCLLNGGLFPETHRARFIQKLLLSPIGPLVNKLTSKSQFKRSFSAVFGPHTKPSDEEIDIFWDIITYKDGKRVFHELISYMRDRRVHRERWLDALRNSCVPLQLINGSLDPVSGAHMVMRFRELGCMALDIVELPDIGHYPQVEAPDKVRNALISFLNQVENKNKQRSGYE